MMKHDRIMPSMHQTFFYDYTADHPVPTQSNHGKRMIQAVDAFIRRTGWSHTKLAEEAGVEPVKVTMFIEEKWPADWIELATNIDRLLVRESEREDRESRMPVMTPIVKRIITIADTVIEDGGIGLIQGDSGVGKSTGLDAVSLRFPCSVKTLATICRARPKLLLEDIASRMHVNAFGRSLGEVYSHVVNALPGRCELLIVDEAHRYIGKADCVHTLVDVLKETGVPQLWTATGDLLRYLNRRGPTGDPFSQVRSRITHQLDLDALTKQGKAIVDADDIGEIAHRKFDLKLDAASRRELADLAGELEAGGVRHIETILKTVKRSVKAGMDVHAAIRKAIDKRAMQRPTRRITTTQPVVVDRPEAVRATA